MKNKIEKFKAAQINVGNYHNPGFNTLPEQAWNLALEHAIKTVNENRTDSLETIASHFVSGIARARETLKE